MGKVNVTYTRDQLRDFTVAELKSLDLYKRAKVDKSAKSKTALITALFQFQKAEQAALKTVAKAKTKKVEKTKEAPAEAKKETKAKAKAFPSIKKEVKSGEPVFHRFKRKRNPHMH